MARQMKEFLYIRDEKNEEKKAYYLNSRVKMVLETYLDHLRFK